MLARHHLLHLTGFDRCACQADYNKLIMLSTLSLALYAFHVQQGHEEQDESLN